MTMEIEIKHEWLFERLQPYSPQEAMDWASSRYDRAAVGKLQQWIAGSPPKGDVLHFQLRGRPFDVGRNAGESMVYDYTARRVG
jgi:hypothetical protein